jgi:non-ribosomal peptide synthetase component F
LSSGACSTTSFQDADLELSASDVIAQTSPQSVVIAVWQFLAALMVGARVHICADEEVRDPALLMQEISREGITVLEIVPTLLREILQPSPSEAAFRALGQLRSLVSTGETLAPDLCRDWFRYFPGVPLINAYGATECSDDVATNRRTAPPTSSAAVPIGRAIANTRLYVLDRYLQPMPASAWGLYVWGIAWVAVTSTTWNRRAAASFAILFRGPPGAAVPDGDLARAFRRHVGVLRPHRPSGEIRGCRDRA